MMTIVVLILSSIDSTSRSYGRFRIQQTHVESHFVGWKMWLLRSKIKDFGLNQVNRKRSEGA